MKGEGESQTAEKYRGKERSNFSCESVFCEPVGHFGGLNIAIIIIIDCSSGLVPSGMASANHLLPSESSPSDSRSGNEKRQRPTIPRS